MRTFKEIEENSQLRRYLRSKRGWLFVQKNSTQDMLIRHFNGELESRFTTTFAEIVEEVSRWVNGYKELERYVQVESVVEIGEDFIILPYHRNYSSLSNMESWDEDDIPEELERMRNILKAGLEKIKGEREEIIKEVLIRSLLESSSKTWYDERIDKFIICEPRIRPEHLERWQKLS